MMAQHGFLGVPVETFEQAGREQLADLLREGLNPESTVLEFGCGCLRIAYWLVRFLDPGCYCGIEPARRRIELGLEYLFTPEDVRAKQPRFDFNAEFDASAFGTRFDFFLARSIWTHAGKRQIEAMLDSFVRNAKPTAVFLASYLPTESSDAAYQAFLNARFPAQSGPDGYDGDRWVGTSHESDTPGVVQHSLRWIKEQCLRRGLTCDELEGVDCDSQLWLRIKHTG
ncbi:MAG: hypothetical protein JWM87_1448 [Candidatus Eremiobacteraeota bacterium]|nr:hypothetical protein [Candidatus Eremiobacteraeota bacterium]